MVRASKSKKEDELIEYAKKQGLYQIFKEGTAANLNKGTPLRTRAKAQSSKDLDQYSIEATILNDAAAIGLKLVAPTPGGEAAGSKKRRAAAVATPRSGPRPEPRPSIAPGDRPPSGPGARGGQGARGGNGAYAARTPKPKGEVTFSTTILDAAPVLKPGGTCALPAPIGPNAPIFRCAPLGAYEWDTDHVGLDRRPAAVRRDGQSSRRRPQRERAAHVLDWIEPPSRRGRRVAHERLRRRVPRATKLGTCHEAAVPDR